jgi:hypothetical protein
MPRARRDKPRAVPVFEEVVELVEGVSKEADEAWDHLSEMREAFVLHYLKDPNAANAARQAGYSGDSHQLAMVAHNLLKNRYIKSIIKERRQFFRETMEMDIKWVLHNLRLAVDTYLIHPETAQHGLRALESIAKHLGMFVERREDTIRLALTETEIVKDYDNASVVVTGPVIKGELIDEDDGNPG